VSDEPNLTLFIPRQDTAVCADCGGVFYRQGRATCPGCGSSAWVHFEQADRVEEAHAAIEAAAAQGAD